MQPPQRIMIIGSGGAGKSTLARQLGPVLGLPVFHLDKLHWQPGWVSLPAEEWQGQVADLAQSEYWIIDGNYSGSLPIRLQAADTVIFLDYPWWRCLGRVLKRWLQYRGRSRPDITEGCPERLNWEMIKWVSIDFPRHNRVRLRQLLQQQEGRLNIITHRSPGETRRWLAALEVEQRGVKHA